MTIEQSPLDRIITAYLAADPPTKGQTRILTAGNPTYLLDAALEAITQTYLPRRLTFMRSDGTALRVDVANGRVLNLFVHSPLADPSESSCSDNKGEPAEIPDVLAHFIDLTTNHTTLTLTWDRIQPEADAQSKSFIPTESSAILNDDHGTGSPKIPAILERIFQVEPAPLSSVIVHEGRTIRDDGTEKVLLLANAWALLDIVPAEAFDLPKESRPRIIILSSGSQTILLVRSGGFRLAAIYKGEQAHVLGRQISAIIWERHN